ncbi:hypothetical protein GJ496_009847 [Pomphorhynchus laevis]|nr:hypothetical protein GJ496_009847 [Pomphorhynchus laevis]
MPIKRGHVRSPETSFVDSIISNFRNQDRCFLIVNASLPRQPIIYCSDRLCTLFGYSKDEILSKSSDILLATTTNNAIDLSVYMKVLLQQAECKKTRLKYVKKEGYEFDAIVTITPVTSAHGTIALFVFEFIDEDNQLYLMGMYT